MAKRKPAQLHGLLVVDKPQGWTSRDVVNKAGWLLREKRAGHAGTLDPMATGILLVAFGEATKGVRWFQDARKSYEAIVHFGQATVSDDADSPVIREAPVPVLTVETVRAALPLPGTLQQIPPAVSALQTDGVRDHERVRRGETIEREPRPVALYEVEILAITPPDVRLRVTCGAGFYVRALARDLGEAMDSAAHLTFLRRTTAGGATLAEAVTVEALAAMEEPVRAAMLVPLVDALRRVLPMLEVDDTTALHLRQGKTPIVADAVAGDVLVLLADGTPVCVAAAQVSEDPAHPGTVLTVERGFHHVSPPRDVGDADPDDATS